MQVTSRGRKANLMLILVILSPIILHTSKITNVVLKKINSPFLFALQFKTPEECSLYKIVLGLSVEDRSPTKAYSFFFLIFPLFNSFLQKKWHNSLQILLFRACWIINYVTRLAKKFSVDRIKKKYKISSLGRLNYMTLVSLNFSQKTCRSMSVSLKVSACWGLFYYHISLLLAREPT